MVGKHLSKYKKIIKLRINTWRSQCEASPYRDAIIRVSARSTFVVESKWQKFLMWRAQKFKEKHLDPHVRQILEEEKLK